MKNIYTTTYYLYNYGSALQALAIQSKIKEFGAQPSILSCKPTSKKVLSPLKRILNVLRSKIKQFEANKQHYSLCQRVKRTCRNSILRTRNSKIQEFVKNNLNVLEISDVDKFLDNLSGNNDVLLTGSDQVWSVVGRPLSPWYTFAWAQRRTDVKKYSYACSIGVETLTMRQRDEFKEALRRFEVVSFRERHAAGLLSQDLPSTVRIDLDPTLLFDSRYWNTFANSKIEQRPYVFVYVLTPDPRVLRIGRKLAEKYNLELVYTDNLADKFSDVQSRYDLTVGEFLTYVKNASFVVTNSFHGTVFSLLFHRPFTVVRMPVKSTTSSRVENLLEIVGLQSRLIDSIDGWKICSDEIDYEKVDFKLAIEREKSTKYLKEICSSETL